MVDQDPQEGPRQSEPGAQASDSPEPEAVWTFRGYRLRPGEFTTAMVHFFRAEISRANIWRTRLDATTNWAVVTTGAAITIAFNPTGYHGVIILNTLIYFFGNPHLTLSLGIGRVTVLDIVGYAVSIVFLIVYAVSMVRHGMVYARQDSEKLAKLAKPKGQAKRGR